MRRDTNKGVRDFSRKLAFWTEQLELAKSGEGRYSVERAQESLTYFRGRQANVDAPSVPRTDGDDAKARAIANCKARFEGMSESERLWEANKFINDACSKGLGVATAMSFLKECEVMSDTELAHSIMF
tara:strand:+ start:274 stop:657 length:384 start_codon:yes stop_codon:yes gene_type:complete